MALAYRLEDGIRTTSSLVMVVKGLTVGMCGLVVRPMVCLNGFEYVCQGSGHQYGYIVRPGMARNGVGSPKCNGMRSLDYFAVVDRMHEVAWLSNRLSTIVSSPSRDWLSRSLLKVKNASCFSGNTNSCHCRNESISLNRQIFPSLIVSTNRQLDE